MLNRRRNELPRYQIGILAQLQNAAVVFETSELPADCRIEDLVRGRYGNLSTYGATFTLPLSAVGMSELQKDIREMGPLPATIGRFQGVIGVEWQ